MYSIIYSATGECDKDCLGRNVTEHLSAGSVDMKERFLAGDVSFARRNRIFLSPAFSLPEKKKRILETVRKRGSRHQSCSEKTQDDPKRRSERHRCDFDSLSAIPRRNEARLSLSRV